MKLIILFLLSFALNAETFVGMTRSKHLVTPGLNDNHLFLGYDSNSFGIVAYQNSFNVLGVAVYKEFSSKLSENVSLNLKLGVTTGYKYEMEYRGESYQLNRSYFLQDGLLLIAVPSIDYEVVRDVELGLSLVGESVNVGIKFRF